MPTSQGIDTVRLPVSVVIPVRNEEENLAACLSRLGRFAEVLVVDSASTDRTVALAQEFGARVVQFAWSGGYPKKRNHVLLNEALAAPWVLFLDADEHVSDAFCDALAATLPGTDKVGFWLNYTNYFLGRQLKHGVAQRKLALIKVGAGLYERIEEVGWSSLDMEIHEHPVLHGTVGEIEPKIDHRDFRSVERFLARHIEYAKWEAARHALLTKEGLGLATHLTGRQRFKYRHLSSWWYPWSYFLFAYGAKCGALDGRAGFAYAFYKAWYFETIRILILERRMSSIARTVAPEVRDT